jgi:hypothetical protein
MLVIGFQSAGHDGFGHGLATRAAELAGFTEDGSGEAAAGRDGQGAVVAGQLGGHLSGHENNIVKTGPGSVARGFIGMPHHPVRLRSSRETC